MVHIELTHIGLQCNNRDEAIIFYQDICGMELVKSTTLPEDLVQKIFNINSSVEMIALKNNDIYIEIFITDNEIINSYNHTCLTIDDTDQFFNECRIHGLNPNIVKKGKKDLYFIRDFSGNLFEIKKVL